MKTNYNEYYYSKDDHAIIANGETLSVGEARVLKVRLEDELGELEEAIDEALRHTPEPTDAYHERMEERMCV